MKSGSTRSTGLVVLVEDNRADVLVIERAIAEHKVPLRILVVEDGEQAIQYLERVGTDAQVQRPELILLDLNLPRWSGIEVLRRLRSGGPCKDVPVIVLTSSDSPEDRNVTANLGIAHYFRKPISYKEFLKIGEIMNRVLRATSPAL